MDQLGFDHIPFQREELKKMGEEKKENDKGFLQKTQGGIIKEERLKKTIKRPRFPKSMGGKIKLAL